jgi:methionine-rich copper-binding protein CopC
MFPPLHCADSAADRTEHRMRTMTRLLRWPTAAVAAAALIAAPAAAHARAAFHLHLLSSDPAAGSTVHATPLAIRLTFSEAPEVRVTSIRATDGRGHAVALGPVHRDRRAPATVFAAVTRALPPGPCRVTWRTMAHDGHPMHGDFTFTVAAHR